MMGSRPRYVQLGLWFSHVKSCHAKRWPGRGLVACHAKAIVRTVGAISYISRIAEGAAGPAGNSHASAEAGWSGQCTVLHGHARHPRTRNVRRTARGRATSRMERPRLKAHGGRTWEMKLTGLWRASVMRVRWWCRARSFSSITTSGPTCTHSERSDAAPETHGWGSRMPRRISIRPDLIPPPPDRFGPRGARGGNGRGSAGLPARCWRPWARGCYHRAQHTRLAVHENEPATNEVVRLAS